MTVLDATSKLYIWFTKNDFFCEEDFLKILTISEHPEADRASLLVALEEFEKSLMVKKSTYKKKDFWILTKSFESFNQTLNIAPSTALIISKIINSYREDFKIKDNYCDPNNIQEGDIKSILTILSEFASANFDKNKTK